MDGPFAPPDVVGLEYPAGLSAHWGKSVVLVLLSSSMPLIGNRSRIVLKKDPKLLRVAAGYSN